MVKGLWCCAWLGIVSAVAGLGAVAAHAIRLTNIIVVAGITLLLLIHGAGASAVIAAVIPSATVLLV